MRFRSLPKNSHLAAWLLRCLFFMLTGCQHKTGSASAAFVDPHEPTVHDSRKLDLAKSPQVYVDAQPIQPLAMPIYPRHALGARAGKTVVLVDITVSPDGRVSHAATNIADLSGLNEGADGFFSAIQMAVQTWEFVPAELDTVRAEPSGRVLVLNSEKIERVFTVAFTFTQQGGVTQSFGAR
jgi:hypothetical protein